MTFFLVGALAWLLGLVAGRIWGLPVEGERMEPPEAWRNINLALGDGVKLDEACEELAALRAAGWHIEKQGNERGGFVYLKLIAPGRRD